VGAGPTEEEFRILEQRHADLGDYRLQCCGILELDGSWGNTLWICGLRELTAKVYVVHA
jgi:hypothetical protein